MTTDPYMDAINAGAAALAKPYRDPDTISAFVETFPTIAAARVIDAALPHLRATIAAEQAPPGPCPATHVIPRLHPDGSPWPLHALCDLRAGHVGQHEAEDGLGEWGHFRWTSDLGEVRPGGDGPCTFVLRSEGHKICVRVPGHEGYHVAETLVWNDRGTVIARGALTAPAPMPYIEQYPELANRCAVEHGSRPGVVCWKQPGHADAHDNGAHMWNDCGEEVQRGV